MKLNELPKERYAVRAQHFRFVLDDSGNNLVLIPNYLIYEWVETYPKGGATVIEVKDLETGIIKIGVSFCSLEDTFNRKKGFQTALDRAMAPANPSGNMDFAANVRAAELFVKHYGSIYIFDK